MLEVSCSGTPHSIGVQHGSVAKAEILRSIIFYEKLFQKGSGLDWQSVKQFALKYQPYLSESWPEYVAEMEGIASGTGLTYADILALNVRTEIAFGAFSDGCTAISWRGEEASFLGQNWDWDTEQAENLICLKIKREDGLNIQMITEAGIIGKIGLNSAGVGCTLNALKAKGVSYNKIPCHLALRAVMESRSREAALETLLSAGVASSCHILIADASGGTGLECSSEDIHQLEMNSDGIITHTNHYILKHDKKVIEAPDWLPDTYFRLRRIGEFVHAVKGEDPSSEVVEKFLKDEMEGDGAAICRSATTSPLETLFSIVMDLGKKQARVSVGRPAHPTEKILLSP